MRTLLIVTGFLALPVCQECTQLCELRNILLTERLYSAHFLLIDSDVPSTLPSAHTFSPEEVSSTWVHAKGIRLFSVGGVPVETTIGGSPVSFWPDEWHLVLGGANAVGQGIVIYCTYGTNAEARWIEGEVKSFCENTGRHTVELTLVDSADKRCTGNGIEAAADEGTTCNSSGNAKSEFEMSDTNGLKVRQRIGKTAFASVDWEDGEEAKGEEAKGEEAKGEEDTEKDVGRVRIGEENATEMAKGNSLVTIVDIEGVLVIEDIGMSNIEVEVDLQSTLFRWTGREEQNSRRSATVSIKFAETLSNSREDTLALCKRPNASLVRHSYYPNMILNEFHRHDGLHNMFRCLRELANDISPGSVPSAGPQAGFRTILLHLKLLSSLKFVAPHSVLMELIWEAKETIPFALRLFGEFQLKDLQRSDILELFSLLRDLIIFVYDNEIRLKSTEILSNDLSVKQVLDSLEEGVELMFLDFCRRLLEASSQISLKLLGLMLIMDKMEVVMPR